MILSPPPFLPSRQHHAHTITTHPRGAPPAAATPLSASQLPPMILINFRNVTVLVPTLHCTCVCVCVCVVNGAFSHCAGLEGIDVTLREASLCICSFDVVFPVAPHHSPLVFWSPLRAPQSVLSPSACTYATSQRVDAAQVYDDAREPPEGQPVRFPPRSFFYKIKSATTATCTRLHTTGARHVSLSPSVCTPLLCSDVALCVPPLDSFSPSVSLSSLSLSFEHYL